MAEGLCSPGIGQWSFGEHFFFFFVGNTHKVAEPAARLGCCAGTAAGDKQECVPCARSLLAPEQTAPVSAMR